MQVCRWGKYSAPQLQNELTRNDSRHVTIVGSIIASYSSLARLSGGSNHFRRLRAVGFEGLVRWISGQSSMDSNSGFVGGVAVDLFFSFHFSKKCTIQFLRFGTTNPRSLAKFGSHTVAWFEARYKVKHSCRISLINVCMYTEHSRKVEETRKKYPKSMNLSSKYTYTTLILKCLPGVLQDWNEKNWPNMHLTISQPQKWVRTIVTCLMRIQNGFHSFSALLGMVDTS